MGTYSGCHELWLILWSEEWDCMCQCSCPWPPVWRSAWEDFGQFEADGRDPRYELWMTTANFSLACLVGHH